MNNKLSDAEYVVMDAIWAQGNVISSKKIRSLLEKEQWKRQTILTLLSRLVNKGFLSLTKNGNENEYTVLVDEKTYLKYETDNFIYTYHKKSLVGFLNTLYSEENIDENELSELRDWIDKKVK